jgi:8-oxo-dGTP pyrophosphatase MutT (NUDIX family)
MTTRLAHTMSTIAPPSAIAEYPDALWPAIAAAQLRLTPRVPFQIEDQGWPLRAGSVARAHLEALARWPEALRVDDTGVTMTLTAGEREPFFAQANATLRDARLIVAWRDETYPVLALESKLLLATFERAASRFWGTLTFGAHCNGCVIGPEGSPSHLWIAHRSFTKATDPGLLDNLIGGGVPHGQTPAEAVLREGWEEAGLRPEQMRALRPGRVARVARDIPEGFQLEELSVYDLALPPGLTPRNQDGEVAELTLMPVAEALAKAASEAMTVDAALATLDFALRHRLLPSSQQERLAQASAALWVVTSGLPLIQSN